MSIYDAGVKRDAVTEKQLGKSLLGLSLKFADQVRELEAENQRLRESMSRWVSVEERSPKEELETAVYCSGIYGELVLDTGEWSPEEGWATILEYPVKWWLDNMPPLPGEEGV